MLRTVSSTRCDGVLAVLFVIVENDAGRENDQRQRGSRDQKSEADWQ